MSIEKSRDEQALDTIRGIVLCTFGFRGEDTDSDYTTIELVVELANEVARRDRSYGALFAQMQMVRDLNNRQDKTIAELRKPQGDLLACRQKLAAALGTSVMEPCSTVTLVERLIGELHGAREKLGIQVNKVDMAERVAVESQQNLAAAGDSLKEIREICEVALGSKALGILDAKGAVQTLAEAFATKDKAADLLATYAGVAPPEAKEDLEPGYARTIVKLKPEAVVAAMKPTLLTIARRLRSKMRAGANDSALGMVASAIEEIVE